MSRSPWPTASTRGLAVLGWPVAHSLSPVMHNAALAHDGLDLVYLALPAPPDRLAEVVTGLGAAGFLGANVTVPHKQAARDACDVLTDEARLVGAVNTLTWRRDEAAPDRSAPAAGLAPAAGAAPTAGAAPAAGAAPTAGAASAAPSAIARPAVTLEGHNTDAIGLGRALDEVGTGEGPAVLLGTGGAARAAVVALTRRGHPVTVVGRRPDAAASLVTLAGDVPGSDHATAPGAMAVSLADDAAVADAVRGATLIVNATPLGMQREDLPAPFMALSADQVAYDLVYAPPDTPFLQAAADVGAGAHHGLSMLVHQAAVAYEHWTGRPAPVDVMRAAAESALNAR